MALVIQLEQEANVPSDAWNAAVSTAGQRALRLVGQESWTTLASSALQRSLNQQQHRGKVSLCLCIVVDFDHT